jgi:Ca-activated chloride channel family protein
MQSFRSIAKSTTALVFTFVSIFLQAQPGISAQEQNKSSKQVQQNVMLILDASGSMLGKVEGKTKISVARNVVSDILKTWKPQVKMGVMKYGHRKKGDCSDIQTLFPLSRVNTHSIMTSINNLDPKGKTPFSASIIKAATILKGKEEAATIVLVSDGLETCNMDPCAVAKKLKSSDISLRVHVVGFDVEKRVITESGV